jgi:hypothetical protein
MAGFGGHENARRLGCGRYRICKVKTAAMVAPNMQDNEPRNQDITKAWPLRSRASTSGMKPAVGAREICPFLKERRGVPLA